MVAIRSVIPEVNAELERIAVEAVRFVVTGVEANAKTEAPIDTGNLANSQSHSLRLFPGGAEGVAASGAEYSAYVNYGTGARGAASNVPGRGSDVRYSAGWTGMAAQPYFSGAAEQARIEWERIWQGLGPTIPRIP